MESSLLSQHSYLSQKDIPVQSGKLICPSLQSEHFSPVINSVLHVHCPLESQSVDSEPVILHRQSEKKTLEMHSLKSIFKPKGIEYLQNLWNIMIQISNYQSRHNFRKMIEFLSNNIFI